MGGKSGGGGGDPSQARGQGRVDIVSQATSAGKRHFDPSKESWQEYYADITKPAPAPQAELPSFDFSSITSSRNDQAKALAKSQREAEMAAKRRERDELYSEYLDAASTATDFINNQIKSEAANAALLGVEFGLTDEQRTQRIQDYFASVWGEGAQTRLETLFDQVGAVEGFEGFDLERGNADNVPEGTKGSETTVSRSRARKPRLGSLAGSSNEEDKLATSSILGG